MEDIYLKESMVIVAIVVIIILVVFVSKIELKQPEPKIQEAKSYIDVVAKLNYLCGECVKKETDRECFIIEIKTDKEIKKEKINAVIKDISTGDHTLKIESKNRKCIVREI